MLIVQWLHVLLAIYWFGGTLYLNTIVIPTLIKLPVGQQRPVTGGISAKANKIFPIVQTLVIVFGVLRGTVFGPINKASDLFETAYGIRFTLSLVLTIVLAGVAHLGTGRSARKLADFPLAEIEKGSGPVYDAFMAQTGKVKMFSILSLVLFVIIFTLMIMLRVGA
jgi:hypothetical protein